MSIKKVPTRSPTHTEVEMVRLPAMGLELEEIADGDAVDLGKLVELAEDRGRPASHYLAAIPLATELHLRPTKGTLVARVCAGNCQAYGALDLLDLLVERRASVSITPIECLDQCDHGPALELLGDHGKLVLAPATLANLDEALRSLASS